MHPAAKSTLINALLKSEVAPVDDIPLTDRVTAYRWGSYNILDTPGVDAPIAHEDVTRAQMLKADVIIFVVDPLGVVEEAKTLEVLLDMLTERNQNLPRLQREEGTHPRRVRPSQAGTHPPAGIGDPARPEGRAPRTFPLHENQCQAGAARLYKRQAGARGEHSDLPVFAQRLQAFLQGIGPNDVYARLQHQLLTFIDIAKRKLENRSQPEVVQKYDKLLQSINAERARLGQAAKIELGRQRANAATR